MILLYHIIIKNNHLGYASPKDGFHQSPVVPSNLQLLLVSLPFFISGVMLLNCGNDAIIHLPFSL